MVLQEVLFISVARQMLSFLVPKATVLSMQIQVIFVDRPAVVEASSLDHSSQPET
jgi:hypothetical protein